MERKTWEEFLSECDASHYAWDIIDDVDIFVEEGIFYVVLVNLWNDEDVEFHHTEDGDIVAEWGGEPVIITDFDTSNAPTAYMVVEEIEKGEFAAATGNLWSTIGEAKEELSRLVKKEVR
jgi:hypothetical protein